MHGANVSEKRLQSKPLNAVINIHMRALEIMPESWWKDLPVNCLAVMGYNGNEEEQPDDSMDSIEQDIKNLRQQKKGL